MNLLLLVSALLSALASVGGGRLTAAPAMICERPVEVRAVRVVAALVAARPTQAPPRLAASLNAVGARFALAAAQPLYASRRRE